MSIDEAIASALAAMRSHWGPAKIRALADSFGARDLVQRAYRALLGSPWVVDGRYGIKAADPALAEAVKAAAQADWDAAVNGARPATEADIRRVLAGFPEYVADAAMYRGVDDDTGALWLRPQEVEDVVAAVGEHTPDALDDEVADVLAARATGALAARATGLSISCSPERAAWHREQWAIHCSAELCAELLASAQTAQAEREAREAAAAAQQQSDQATDGLSDEAEAIARSIVESAAWDDNDGRDGSASLAADLARHAARPDALALLRAVARRYGITEVRLTDLVMARIR